MKRIDSWLDIQRFLSEASRIEIPRREVDVEMMAKATHSHSPKGRVINQRYVV